MRRGGERYSTTLMSTLAAGEWAERALCDPEAAELWFPLDVGNQWGTSNANADQVAAAKAICNRCPVRQACLDAALVSRERHGIWGGLTPPERAEILLARPRPAAADPPEQAPRRKERAVCWCGRQIAEGRTNRRYCSRLCEANARNERRRRAYMHNKATQEVSSC